MPRSKPRPSAFAQKLRRLRVERRMTQAAVSKLSGVSRTQVATMELGRSVNPTLRKLKRLAVALGVSVGELVEDDSNALAETVMRLRRHVLLLQAALTAAMGGSSAGEARGVIAAYERYDGVSLGSLKEVLFGQKETEA